MWWEYILSSIIIRKLRKSISRAIQGEILNRNSEESIKNQSCKTNESHEQGSSVMTREMNKRIKIIDEE